MGTSLGAPPVRVTAEERVSVLNSAAAEWKGSKSLQKGTPLMKTYIDGALVERHMGRVTEDELAAVSGPADGPHADRAATINAAARAYDDDPAIRKMVASQKDWVNSELREAGHLPLTGSETTRVRG